MKREVAALLRQSGLYALSNVAIKLAGLLLAPLFLNVALLPQADYGHLVVLEVTAQIGALLAGPGIGAGLLKFLTDPAYEEDHAALPLTALLASAALSVLVVVLFWGLDASMARLLVGDAGRAELIRLLGVYIAFKGVANVPLMVLRARERAGWYAASVAFEWTVLVGGVYYFLALQEAGLAGVLTAYVYSAGASTLVLTVGLLVTEPIRLRAGLIRPLARYGTPIVFGSLASLFLTAGDRYLMQWLTDAEAVAVYGWASRLGGALNMLFVQSFQMAFLVIGLKSLTEGGVSGRGRLHQRVFRHYSAVTGFAALGLSLVTYDATRWLSSDASYLGADVLVLPISLGFLAYGLWFIAVNALYALERTRLISLIVFAAALGNALLNLVLIPPLGGLGAALATLVSFAALAVVTARWAGRYTPIAYPWRAPVLVTVLVTGLWALAQPSLGWGVLPRLGWRLGLLALYPPLVIATGVYSWEEIRLLWAAARAYVADLRGEAEHPTEQGEPPA